TMGSYEILGIRFAQFVKTDIDFRYYVNFNKSSKLVYRTALGVGVPMANLKQALPFEKSFYVGGSNGLRAFRARSIGPGNFYDTTTTFDKTGDILMEGNIEYRFDLLKIVKGALFYDVGNVWLIKQQEGGREQGHITSNFYKQLAMGAGIGLRVDLDFFLFRFDFAYPLRQPGLPDGEKWFFQEKTITNQWLASYAENNGTNFVPFKSKLILNIGIGYPF
ncbi:MAG TPA: BamA/TamA family outer membrane protein, partial [Flavobacteriales bacterium]|nr:BamA/TamA family outer membrane protein [Flavobacteriales bacterium]